MHCLINKALLSTLLIFFGFCPSAFAVSEKPALTEYMDTTGVSIEYDSSTGEWTRIRAIGDASCVICDARDINLSVRKAELRAKSSIAKFLKEKISTSEVMEETVKTLSEHNGRSESVNRKTLETQVESIQSSASAILKGVLILEQKSDPITKNITTTVGISSRTMATADLVNRALETDLSLPGAKANGVTPTIKAQTRRNKAYSDF